MGGVNYPSPHPSRFDLVGRDRIAGITDALASDDVLRALARFRDKCRFEPETGCVIWTGGQTMGRGHHVPYGSFWFEGRRWFAHRWAAKFIHGLDIDGFQVDHCCEATATPNTLCVQHLQAATPKENRDLQTMRKRFVFLQKGLLDYADVYGFKHEPDVDAVPFYSPPRWLLAA